MQNIVELSKNNLVVACVLMCMHNYVHVYNVAINGCACFWMHVTKLTILIHMHARVIALQAANAIDRLMELAGKASKFNYLMSP